jgi:hypothetical protein
MSKLRGILLIGNTLFPAVVVAIVAGMYMYYEDDVKNAWRNTEAALTQIVEGVAIVQDDVEELVADTKEDADEAIAHFRKVKKKFDDTYAKVEKPFATMSTLSVPTVTVGTRSKKYTVRDPITDSKVGKVTVTMPTIDTGSKALGAIIVQPFTDAFGVVKAAVDPLSNIVESVDQDIAMLQRKVPEEARKVQLQVAVVAQQVLSVAKPLGNIFEMVVYLIVVLVFWFALSYVSWAHERLVRGWMMLQGESLSA